MVEAILEEPTHGASTVERAADVLLYFVARNAADLGVTEIATALAMSKAGVYRILSSLRSRGLVSCAEDSHRYSLGPATMALGLAYVGRLNVRRMGLPDLRGLSSRTGETATLALRSGLSRVYVDQVTPRRESATVVPVGVPIPLHVGAPSKALLAHLPTEQREAYLQRALAAVTADTTTDPGALRRQLDVIRDRGWARSRGERQPGAVCVAAPVYGERGAPVAVIGLCGPADRFQADGPETVRLLLATAKQLSARLSQGRAS